MNYNTQNSLYRKLHKKQIYSLDNIYKANAHENTTQEMEIGLNLSSVKSEWKRNFFKAYVDYCNALT